MLSTDSRLDYFARLQTPYMNTTDMCLELYYQIKSTAVVNKSVIEVGVINEEKRLTYLASSNGDNRTSWERLFAKLPDGLHQIVIEGMRSATHYCGMSIDDIVVQPCEKFGEFLSHFYSTCKTNPEKHNVLIRVDYSFFSHSVSP